MAKLIDRENTITEGGCSSLTDVRAVVTRNSKELPLVLTPMDVSVIMGISKNNAYRVVHSKGFPVIRVGKQYRIPRDKFLIWLATTTEVA